MMRFLLFLFLSLPPLLVQAKQETPSKTPKICLNMIVKNEARVIKRCLDSAKPLFDYWIIVDTGSTDGTQAIIKEHLKDIPGELYERPWRNFGENRSEAFALAKGKGDYILFMDADDVLEFEKDFQLPPLTKDLYQMWRGPHGFSYIKPQLAKGDLPWKWVGVTHEYLDCGQMYTVETLQKVKYITSDGGASSYDAQKFWKNVKLLEEGFKKEPKNERYAFYLAESYYDAGEKGKALEWYQKRVNMGGFQEEVFWSRLRIGTILHTIGLPVSTVVDAYMHAHTYRPHRVEPIYYLAELYNQQGNYKKAYECLKAHAFIPKPAEKDILFNMDWMEEYGLLFQLSICSYFVGNYQEALDACDQLLKIKSLPEWWRKQTEINRRFPLEKLKNLKALQ